MKAAVAARLVSKLKPGMAPPGLASGKSNGTVMPFTARVPASSTIAMRTAPRLGA